MSKTALTEVELPEAEQIQANAFRDSSFLRRIAIPLKADLFDRELDEGFKVTAFDDAFDGS